jgi:hypothetical protein
MPRLHTLSDVQLGFFWWVVLSGFLLESVVVKHFLTRMANKINRPVMLQL